VAAEVAAHSVEQLGAAVAARVARSVEQLGAAVAEVAQGEEELGAAAGVAVVLEVLAVAAAARGVE